MAGQGLQADLRDAFVQRRNDHQRERAQHQVNVLAMAEQFDVTAHAQFRHVLFDHGPRRAFANNYEMGVHSDIVQRSRSLQKRLMSFAPPQNGHHADDGPLGMILARPERNPGTGGAE